MFSYWQWRTWFIIPHVSHLVLIEDVISMIKDSRAWSSFSIEMAEFEVIKGGYQNFKIMYVPRAQNKTDNVLAKTAKFFMVIYFLLVVLSRLNFKINFSLSDRTIFWCQKKSIHTETWNHTVTIFSQKLTWIIWLSEKYKYTYMI